MNKMILTAFLISFFLAGCKDDQVRTANNVLNKTGDTDSAIATVHSKQVELSYRDGFGLGRKVTFQGGELTVPSCVYDLPSPASAGGSRSHHQLTVAIGKPPVDQLEVITMSEPNGSKLYKTFFDLILTAQDGRPLDADKVDDSVFRGNVEVTLRMDSTAEGYTSQLCTLQLKDTVKFIEGPLTGADSAYGLRFVATCAKMQSASTAKSISLVRIEFACALNEPGTN